MNQDQDLILAIRHLLAAQGVLAAIERDLIEPEAEGMGVGLPTAKDQLRDALDEIDGAIDTLEQLEL